MVAAPKLSTRNRRAHSIRLPAIGALSAAVALPTTALAHERFVKHDVLRPFPHDFFFHVDHNVVSIAVRVCLAMVAVLFLWFRRHAIEALIETKLRAGATGRRADLIRFGLRFVTDQPVAARWFERIGEWAVILFLRCPGLVLMYAAANSSLVMPTYPLTEPTKALFQYASVALGIAIITQLALPLCGAAIFAIGWMKIYNPDDVIGVAQNFPTVTEDVFIKLFYCGTDPRLKTGCWLVAFALSEVLSGFLLMVGVFSRAWSLQLVYVFTKLMVVDFGWPEIPHLYPIGAFLLLAFSNQLSNELDGEPRAAGDRRWWRPRWGLATATALSWLLIFPLLYALTLTQRPFLRAATTTRTSPPAAISGPPQTSSVLATSGAWISGAGMPSDRKYCTNPLSLPSLPSPEPKNSIPTAIRTINRTRHSRRSSRA